MRTIRKTLVSTLVLSMLAAVILAPVSATLPTAGQRAASGAPAGGAEPASNFQVEVSDPVIPVETIALRDAPIAVPEFILDREVNPRLSTNPDFDPKREGVNGIDPLLAVQAAAQPAAPSDFTTPIVNMDGQGYTFLNPPDTVGDVGADHFIQMINDGGGASIMIYDKTGAPVAGPITLASLGSGGACASGLGDPIVLYDELADRWLLSEFASSGSHLCVYISQTPDPTGSYWRYDFITPSFPDYPKYAVWPDAYYVTSNENNPAAYALDRTSMLSGAAATSQRFTAPNLSGFPFQALTPADLDGPTPPAAGTPDIIMRHRDTEVHGPAGMPTQDILEMWQLDVDWATPANSTFTQMPDILVSEFDSDLCGLSSFNCFPQPGSGTTLDPLREVIMFRLQYRNFGSHEILVGNFVTDVDGTNHGGVRWFELRRSGGAWSLHQEGTYAPDASHRWMGAISMDGSGNIALGYNVSDATSVFPSLRYVGRLATDPLGVMTTAETTLVAGAAANGSNRYGDYSAMSVDPADGCTFWFTGEYNAASTWSTRIGAFKFNQCTGGLGPNFTLEADPSLLNVCAPGTVTTTLLLDSHFGFSQSVFLTDTVPAGVTTAFSDNPVIPTAATVYTATADESVAAGAYDLVVTGAGVTLTHQVTVSLVVNTPAASVPNLVSPADGTIDVPVSDVVLQWDAVTGATSYRVQVDDDADFSSPLVDVSGLPSNTYTVAGPLDQRVLYYWRVSSNSICGENFSQAFTFGTLPPAGICSVGASPLFTYRETFETGSTGWTHEGVNDTWATSSTRVHEGSYAFHAVNPASVSDQRLISPPVTLPADLSDLTLQYWNYQAMEDRAGGCYDGGLLEISTDGGGSWKQMTTGLLTDPYDGPISANYGNPLGGQNAWCGDPQDWLNSVVELDAYAGQTVQFRFRLGSDESSGREGWYVDDLVVQGCTTEPVTYTLGVGTTGSGWVALDPDQPGYTYGEMVTLTANADPGWGFTGWSGDLSGSDNPAALTIDSGKFVTATFEQLSYTLDVNVTGGGAVNVEPQQASYFYGDVVTLTAVPQDGWNFTAWSGDLSGLDNPVTLLMDGNKSVTALFEAIGYELTTHVVGSGTITPDPDLPGYTNGITVTLTAAASTGWVFVGWSGALGGTDNPAVLTMNGDKDVTATFVAQVYSLDLSVTGMGSITADPDKTSYAYGEVVTLTATADSGWVFVGWGGDLSGSDSSVEITVTADMNIIANFSPVSPTIYLPLVTR